MNQTIPHRFFSLDVLRGLAALGVVLWHWQNFFLPLNGQGIIFVNDKQPFYEVLYFFYMHGYAAVQLFFCLSGFIFFWLYSQRVYEQNISFKKFSILRLSRLYPLHLVTLIFVAICQLFYTDSNQTSFVYQFNDTFHMFLQLLFISSWGVESGFSFNGPIWSVSVEILLYGIFFIFCRLFHTNIMALIIGIILGYIITKFNHHIGGGVMFFFIGGFVFILYEHIIKSNYFQHITVMLPILCLIFWIVAITATNPNINLYLSEQHKIVQKIFSNTSIIFLFPITVISLALLETKIGKLGKSWSIVGDISYSSYLLHFPLQIVIALMVINFNINHEVFYSPWFMLSFFVLLIALSIISHHYFEIPMQHYIRKKFK